MDSNMSLSEIEEQIDQIKFKIKQYSVYKKWEMNDILFLLAFVLQIIVIIMEPSILKVIWLIVLSGINQRTIKEKLMAYLAVPDYEKELHQLQYLKEEKKKQLKEQSKTNTQLESILDHLSQLSKDELKIAEMVIKEYTKPEDPVQKISTVTSILTQAEYGLDPDEITVESEKNKEFSLKR